MRKLVKILIVGCVLGALAYFGARLPEKWNEEKHSQEAVALERWEQDKGNRSRLPAHIRRIDELIAKKEFSAADEEISRALDSAPELARSALLSRRAEIHYRSCERHIVNFDYFFSVSNREAAGDERDGAVASCEAASSALAGMQGSAAEYYRAYDEGNNAVRKAITAASQEAQVEALRTAIRAYKKALDVVGEDSSLAYDPRINLELLFSLQKNAENAAKSQSGEKKDPGPLTPDQFNLKPRDPGPGAGSGSNPKSRL